MARMRISQYLPEGTLVGIPTTYPNGGGYPSLRHLQVNLRWRWRRNPYVSMRVVPTGIEYTRYSDTDHVVVSYRQLIEWLEV